MDSICSVGLAACLHLDVYFSRYLDDVLTAEEAVQLLDQNLAFRTERENRIMAEGFPAYTTSVGWLGYSDQKIEELSKESLSKGFTAFKMKVGTSLEDDKRRLS